MLTQHKSMPSSHFNWNEVQTNLFKNNSRTKHIHQKNQTHIMTLRAKSFQFSPQKPYVQQYSILNSAPQGHNYKHHLRQGSVVRYLPDIFS